MVDEEEDRTPDLRIANVKSSLYTISSVVILQFICHNIATLTTDYHS